jgi:rhodanese-related sulfurtransferase
MTVVGTTATRTTVASRPTATVSAPEVRAAFLTRTELALLDLRDESSFAEAHPLFAAQLPLDRLEIEIAARVPRPDTRLVLYDGGEGWVEPAVARLRRRGYANLYVLAGGIAAWRNAGFELFRDVNSYSKAFGELVQARRHTPSMAAHEVRERIDRGANLAVLDARRFDEYETMSIPTATSVPGAELVLRAQAVAPDPATTIVVNCAGRTRSILGAQSLINAGVPNRVVALRNGTIGWTLAGQKLDTGQQRRAPEVSPAVLAEAKRRARDVAYRAGVRTLGASELAALGADSTRTLYRFDVRTAEEYAAGHLPGFLSAPGGQLVQEIDLHAPVRGARIVLADALGVRADMTASWLAQMAWEVYVLEPTAPSRPSFLPIEDGSAGSSEAPPARGPEGRYRRPYEGTDHPAAAIQAYLDWEHGLVDQLARDGTHGFFVL